MPLTGTDGAWIGIGVIALIFAVSIVFIAQNTGTVEVTFLWMHRQVPLALVPLIIGVGTAALAIVVAALRAAQLRRRSH